MFPLFLPYQTSRFAPAASELRVGAAKEAATWHFLSRWVDDFPAGYGFFYCKYGPARDTLEARWRLQQNDIFISRCADDGSWSQAAKLRKKGV